MTAPPGAAAAPRGDITDHAPRLAALVGREHVIDDPGALGTYARDESPFPELRPLLVVRPGDVAEVAGVVRLANDLGFAVLTRGSGFSIAGFPALDPRRALFLDMRRLNRVLAIDDVNMTVTAQAGIITSDLLARVSERGLAVHTVSVPVRHTTLGGVLSGVVGGGLPLDCAVVGVNVDQLLGLKVVLPTSEVVSTNAGGANRHRCAATLPDGDGPLLTSMFVGDGGSLGVKVEATLRLTPAPRHTHADSWILPDFEAAWGVMSDLSRVRESPFTWLAATEISGGWDVSAVAARADRRYLELDVETLERVLREHGAQEGTPERRLRAQELVEPGSAWTDDVIALDRALVAFVFGNRQFPDALSRIRDFLGGRFAERDLADRSLSLRTTFSPLTRHAAYTSISLVYDPRAARAREETARLAREAYELVVQLGGYSEPHQGVVARVLAQGWSDEYACAMTRVKTALDPRHVVNPGLWSS